MIISDILSNLVDKNNRIHQFSLEKYDQMLPHFEQDSKIASNIFQICLLGNDSSAKDVFFRLPLAFRENIDKLKKNNPNYRYRLFSDIEAKQFILQYYGEKILYYYQRIDDTYLAAKADFLRYLLLYAFGGVYLDLKSSIEFPLSKTLRKEDRFLVFYWDNLPGGQQHYLIPTYITKGEMLQTFIISARGHLFLRKVIMNVLCQIDQYNPHKNGIGWEGTLTTTGPVLYTKVIFEESAHCADPLIFREAKPWQEFGFKFYFAGEYTPGFYHKALSMKNYRKNSRPVIICSQKLLQIVNVIWLRVLYYYRMIIVH